jgi:Bax protein
MSSSRIEQPPASATRLTPPEIGLLAVCVVCLGGFLLVDGDRRHPPPPDFASMPIETKKREFFAYLSPIISEINFGLAADRRRVQELTAAYQRDEPIGWVDRRWLGRLAERLDVDTGELTLGEALVLLERRAGIVPESIVLVQAAVESGWGTSRFALEGNNYFGQRCYRANCGMAPQGRQGARFGLARFSSPAASVESYILNLNTHESYRSFRELRHRRRVAGDPITGLSLVDGLRNYSERGPEYVAEIASMIRDNDLE